MVEAILQGLQLVLAGRATVHELVELLCLGFQGGLLIVCLLVDGRAGRYVHLESRPRSPIVLERDIIRQLKHLHWSALGSVLLLMQRDVPSALYVDRQILVAQSLSPMIL